MQKFPTKGRIAGEIKGTIVDINLVPFHLIVEDVKHRQFPFTRSWFIHWKIAEGEMEVSLIGVEI